MSESVDNALARIKELHEQHPTAVRVAKDIVNNWPINRKTNFDLITWMAEKIVPGTRGAAAKEREACAKMLEKHANAYRRQQLYAAMHALLKSAAAVRARGDGDG